MKRVASRGSASPSLRRRLKVSGLLLASGLLVEAVSLQWAHPTAFLAFLVLGILLVTAGVVVYLLSLIAE